MRVDTKNRNLIIVKHRFTLLVSAVFAVLLNKIKPLFQMPLNEAIEYLRRFKALRVRFVVFVTEKVAL